jgi:2-haloacid dehalogenase/putative hydrolase of the HAD superfamily
MSRRYDALFLDFYGTLVVGDRTAVEATCACVVRDHNLPMTAAELAVAWGHKFFGAIAQCNHDGFLTLYDCECRTLLEAIAEHAGQIDPRPYAELLRAYWKAPPLAPNALEALRAIDVPICIVSNADTADVLAAIDHHGLPIEHVVTSEDTRSYKPDAVIFRTALERMKVAPQRVLHAGDSLHSDVGGAGTLGIATCWVHYSDRILDVGACTPDHRITNLSQLPAIIRDGHNVPCRGTACAI